MTNSHGARMRIVLALLLASHAIAHLPGFLVDWRLSTFDTLPYRTTILWGALDLGDSGIRVVGTLWLLAGAAFLVCAVGAALRTDWWGWIALGSATLSLALSVTALPETRIGTMLNPIILVGVVLYQLGGVGAHAR